MHDHMKRLAEAGDLNDVSEAIDSELRRKLDGTDAPRNRAERRAIAAGGTREQAARRALRHRDTARRGR